MEMKLDIKYNIPAIKAFLNIFDLTLEDKDEVLMGDILKAFRSQKQSLTAITLYCLLVSIRSSFLKLIWIPFLLM